MTVFIRGDYLMNGRDAAILAGRIYNYWRARGPHKNLRVWSERIPIGEIAHTKRLAGDAKDEKININDHAMYQVRSNLINGLPPND